MSFTNLYSGVRSKVGRFLTDDGLPAGTYNSNLNFATPTRWKMTVPDTEVYVIDSALLHVVDTGQIGAHNYGADDELINGIVYGVTLKGVDYAIGDSLLIKQNHHYAMLTHEMDVADYGSGNRGYITATIDFGHGNVTGGLHLEEGDSFYAIYHDDFSVLDEHTVFLKGDRYV